jgi:hypothetical protein
LPGAKPRDKRRLQVSFILALFVGSPTFPAAEDVQQLAVNSLWIGASCLPDHNLGHDLHRPREFERWILYR